MTNDQKNIVVSLFREIGHDILQFVYRFSGDKDIAEDVTQQTYFLACLKINTLREHPNPRGWLFVTARYLMLRELAGAHYKQRVDIEDLEDILSTGEGEKSMAELLPEGLEDEEREFLLEHLEQGYSLAEMAEKRGITAEACRKKYTRIRNRCRELMIREREELEKI